MREAKAIRVLANKIEGAINDIPATWTVYESCFPHRDGNFTLVVKGDHYETQAWAKRWH